MNKFTYENQGTNTYLVYRISSEETIDSLELGMITNNTIPGLAQTMCIQMDTDKFIKYNVSAKVSVSQFFSGVINKARLLGVFNGIVDALINSEDYMIDRNTLVFDLDYIFSDVSTCETVLICLPIMDADKPSVDLGMFFKNIMFSSQFDQTENCDYVAKIMNYLNSTPTFSFVDFKNVLKEIGSSNDTAKEIKYTAEPVVYETKQKAQPTVAPVSNSAFNSYSTPMQQPVVTNVPVKNTSGAQELNSNMAEAVFEMAPTEVLSENEAETAKFEKPMSKFYLMQHYTKENKAIYEAQRAAKKAGNKLSKEATPSSNKEEKPMSKAYLMQHYTKENKAIYESQQAAKKKGSKKPTSKNENLDAKNRTTAFAVPGASSDNVGFAVPGQNAPVVSNVSSTAVNVAQPMVSPSKEPPAIKQPEIAHQTAIAGSGVNIHQNAAMYSGYNGGFGETVVLNASMAGDTTVLNPSMVNEPVAAPHLIRVKDGRKVYINKPVFRIGKEKSYVDFFIGDNSAISRSHANILVRADKYYIVDTNSTNHTYIDGKVLQSNSEYEIVHGTKIRFANEDFEFKVY